METEIRHHFEWKEVKTGILKFILSCDCPVNEPDVSRFLQSEYKEFNRSTINKHLHELVKLDFIEPAKAKSKFKFYDIKFKNIKYIMNEFPNVRLNEFEKPKLISLNEYGHSLSTIEGLKIYIRLFLSPSFFKLYIENNTETLLLKTWKFYKCNRGFPFHPIIDTTRVKYETMKEEIKEDNLPDFLIVQENFLKILGELPDDIPKNKRLLCTQFAKMVDEKVDESFSDEIVRRFLKSHLNEYIHTIHSGYLFLLSDHFCFFEDMLFGTPLPEEINFMEKTSDNLASMLEVNNRKSSLDDMKNESFNYITDWYLKDFKLMSKVIFKHHTPSTFGIFNSSDEVFEFLKKKYKNELDIYKLENEHVNSNSSAETIKLTKDGKVPLMKYNVKTGKMEPIYKN